MGNKRRGPSFKKLLRDAIKREGSQEKLANKLGLGRTAIGAWLTGQAKPSVKAIVNLGNQSPFPDRLFLWKLAGLNEQALKGAAGEIVRESTTPPDPSQTFLVPHVKPTAQGFEELGDALPVSTRAIPEGIVAGYMVVGEELKSIGLAPGDILLLDTHIRDAKDPRPFWGQPVLVAFGSGGRIDYPETVFLGRLSFEVMQSNLYSSWGAVLWPWPGCELDKESGLISRIGVGTWPANVDMRNPHPPRFAALDAIRLEPGTSIIARVVGWFGTGTCKRNGQT